MYYLSYLLLILALLFYDFYHHDLTVFIHSSNETAAIERVLQQLPTCTTDDLARQRALLYTLQQWTQLAHSHHIRYWISHETLIGYVQHHRMLPYAQSIDISILADDTPALIPLLKVNRSSRYELKIHPQWNMAKTSNRSLFPSQGIGFRQYNAQFVDRQANISINIWPAYDQYPRQSILVQYDSGGQQRVIPENWIFSLHPCVFSGMKVWCPAQPKTLALASYDSIRTKHWCIDGIWVSPSSMV